MLSSCDVQQQWWMYNIRTGERPRPSVSKTNRPNPKAPSLGWPRPLLLTPQPLTQVIQLRTISSSLFTTKSKKLLPMAEVVETRRLLEQYIIVQFMLNWSRIKAVRKDLLERWSNESFAGRDSCLLSSLRFWGQIAPLLVHEKKRMQSLIYNIGPDSMKVYSLTLNWKLEALSVITVISWAVEALCCFGARTGKRDTSD